MQILEKLHWLHQGRSTEYTFYIGETGDVMRRLEMQNDHHFTHAFTTQASDWQILLSGIYSQKHIIHRLNPHLLWIRPAEKL